MKKEQAEALNPLDYFSRVRIGIYMLSVYLEMILDISNCPRIKNLDIHTEKFNDSFEDTILKKEMPYENTVHIKVKFDCKVAFRVYDELNGEIIEDSDGNLYTEIEVPNDYNLYNYIFSFGDGAEVLEPKEIRMQIKEMINKMAEKYIT